MMLGVYSRAGDAWLLVPRRERPSHDAVASYGPLHYAGEFPWSLLSAREHSVIADEINRATFALIPSRTARRMMTTQPSRPLNDACSA